MLYHKYAKLLLELHRVFHDLILKEFDKPEDFDKSIWETKLCDKLKGKIRYNQYNSYITKGKYIFRPSVKVHVSSNYEPYFIEYRSYSGKVSKNIKEKTEKYVNSQKNKYNDNQKLLKIKFKASKKSLYDFYLNTGNRYKVLYNGDATHFNLFTDLKNHSNYINCLRIWRGDDFLNEIKCHDEKDALTTLSWLMFEQELNYGESIFQQHSNFKASSESSHRTRDMLIGFLNMLFSDKKIYDDYPHWNKGKKAFPHFGNEDGVGYKNLPEIYKKYFMEFDNPVKYKDVSSILINEYSGRFEYFANCASQNPHFNNFDI